MTQKQQSLSYRKVTANGDIFPETQEMIHIGRRLRKNQTIAEAHLWQQLRGRKLGGFKFHRQHPLGGFITDFYCRSARLAIEVDGSIHDLEDIKKRDLARDEFMKEAGIFVVRFTNDQVLNDTNAVLENILKKLLSLTPSQPSPHQGKENNVPSPIEERGAVGGVRSDVPSPIKERARVRSKTPSHTKNFN